MDAWVTWASRVDADTLWVICDWLLDTADGWIDGWGAICGVGSVSGGWCKSTGVGLIRTGGVAGFGTVTCAAGEAGFGLVKVRELLWENEAAASEAAVFWTWVGCGATVLGGLLL